MADDMTDLVSAYKTGGAGWATPAAAPIGRAVPGVLTVTPGPAPSPTGGATLDDMADLHAAFGKDGFSNPPQSAAAAAGSQVGDLAASAASGVVRGVAAAPFVIPDMAKTIESTLWNAGEYGIRKLIGQPKSYHDISEHTKVLDEEFDKLSLMPSERKIGAAIQQGLTPYLHAPTTTAGQYAETAGEFAPLVAANPASLARLGTVGGAASTLAGHVLAPAVGSETAGQVADRVAPDFSEVARLGGGMAGGMAYGGAAAGVDGLAHTPAVAKAVASVPGLRGVGTGLQQDIAARTIAKNAADLPTLTQNLAPSFTGDSAIPDFQPTTGQLTGDQGVLNLERGASRSSAFAPDYAQRGQEQQQAQNAAIANVQPQGDIAYAPQAVQARLDAIDQAAHAHVDTLRQQAQDQAQAAGIDAGGTPDQQGADLRGHLDAANQAARAHEKALWEAVDPEGKLAHAMAPVKDAFASIYDNLPRADAANLTPFERSLPPLLAGFGPVEPFGEVQALKSNLAAAMREERITKGQTPALARMSRLMGPVQDTINKVVARHVETEGHAVAQGSLDFDQTTLSRLRDRYGVAGPEDAAGVSGRTGTDAEDVSGAGAQQGAGAGGASDAAAGRPEPIPGDPGASPQPRDADETAPRVGPPVDTRTGGRPQSLVSFLTRQGGVQDQGGNLKAAGLDRRHSGLVTRNGLPLDMAREMAAEAGYLGPDTDHAVANTDINDLLDKIAQHPSYSVHDEDRVARRAQRSEELAYQREFRSRRQSVLDTLTNEHGIDPADIDDRLLNRAAYHHMDGLPAAHAYEIALTRDMMHDGEAAHAAAEETPDLRAHFDEIGRSLGQHGELDAQRFGGPEARDEDGGPRAGAASAPDGQEPRGAVEALGEPDEAASGRLRAASTATRERAQTYKEGPVKPILAQGARAGEFKLPDSQVPDRVLRNGPGGYDSVKAYLKGTNNNPASIAALESALTARLRAKALSDRDGTLGQDGLDKWKLQHQHHLRALDEVSPGFSSRFDDPAKASTAVAGATREHAQALADYRKGAAGKLLGVTGEDEVVRKVGDAIRGGKSKVDALLDAVKGDPDAVAGVKAAAGQWWANTFKSPLEAGTSGERANNTRVYLKVLNQHREALSSVLTPEQLRSAGKIAETFDQAQRSRTGGQVGSGSPTSQNEAARKRFFPEKGEGGHAGAHGSLMTALAAGAYLGYEHGGEKGALLGAAPAAGGYMIKALREAGLHDVGKIINDALMNPDRMRQLLARLPETGSRGDKAAAGALRRSFLASGAADETARRERIEPTFGSVDRTGSISDLVASQLAQPEAAPARRAVDPGALPHPVHDDRSADGRYANPDDTHGALRGALDQARGDVAAMKARAASPRIEPTIGSGDRAAPAPLRDMLARYDVGGGHPLSAIGTRLATMIGDMPVHAVDRDQLREMAAGRLRAFAPGYEPSGFYDPRANHIVALKDELADKTKAAQLMVHEGLHGALWHAINASDGARSVIDHLRGMAQAVHFERGGEADEHYGLSNAHEFVSEAMSNPEFQSFLASIPADERTVSAYGLDAARKPSLWQAFTQAVRKIFGLAPGHQTYLDAAMKVTGHMLDQAEAGRPRPPAGASAAPAARRVDAGPPLTHRATTLLPDIRDKAQEVIDKAAPPTASDFGKRIAANPAMTPALLSVALAPRHDGMDLTYRTSWRTLESKGMFSDQERAVLERDAPRLRRVVQRAYPQAREAEIAALPPFALRAAAFAHFANGREEEGMMGEHLHIGARRAFERVYGMFSGLQSLGNRMGLYRPSDVFADRSRPTLAGLGPTMAGEALRAQQ